MGRGLARFPLDCALTSVTEPAVSQGRALLAARSAATTQAAKPPRTILSLEIPRAFDCRLPAKGKSAPSHNSREADSC
jgi:hypothetical protein